MKYTFAILLCIHGLIHLMGFVKAFYLTDINMQVLGLSKPMGSLWLIVFILFVISASQLLTQKKWFYIVFVTVFISQFLIILVWQEAKYGTIINIIILLASMSAFGNHRFDKMVEAETKAIIIEKIDSETKIITEADLKKLPEIVKLWLQRSHVVGNERVYSVSLIQQGHMRTKPDSKWMPFRATQYFNVDDPSFVWYTSVNTMPLMSMVGRDKFWNGEGEMLIKLAGLIPVVNVSNNEKINSGTMLRYLSELCWFPQAVINDYIEWEPMSSTSAKATFTYKNQSVFGTFSFTEEGDVMAFEAQRYYGGTEDSKLENWRVETSSFKKFDGIRIPNQCKVIWQLEEGDFHWLSLEIIDIAYN